MKQVSWLVCLAATAFLSFSLSACGNKGTLQWFCQMCEIDAGDGTTQSNPCDGSNTRADWIANNSGLEYDVETTEDAVATCNERARPGEACSCVEQTPS